MNRERGAQRQRNAFSAEIALQLFRLRSARFAGQAVLRLFVV